MKYLLVILGVVFLAILIKSCSKDYKEENEQDILDYLEANNLQASPTGSGLYYTINTQGTGQFPNINNEVTVYYRGYTLSGQVFDSRLPPDEPISFPLTNVIEGWQEGIPLISNGGEATLYVPAHLGYGSDPPTSSIPSNGVIVFDVTLINFK